MLYIIKFISNIMFDHDHTVNSFLRATVIPKNLRLDCTTSRNYRAIALNNIFGKVLDTILLNRKISGYQTSNLQFGFKENIMFAVVVDRVSR